MDVYGVPILEDCQAGGGRWSGSESGSGNWGMTSELVRTPRRVMEKQSV